VFSGGSPKSTSIHESYGERSRATEEKVRRRERSIERTEKKKELHRSGRLGEERGTENWGGGAVEIEVTNNNHEHKDMSHWKCLQKNKKHERAGRGVALFLLEGRIERLRKKGGDKKKQRRRRASIEKTPTKKYL